MLIEICHLWKTYSFFLFRFLIKRSAGLVGSRWTFLIRRHAPFKINWFPLVSVNLGVKYFYRINEIMGCFFCRDISSIYAKIIWGNFIIIPRIYKCEAFVELFKLNNQLWIINNFFITFSSNILNPEKLSSCAQTEFLIGIILYYVITQGDTINGRPLIGWSCVGSYIARKKISFVNIHTANNFENIFNYIIKFGRSLTDFVMEIISILWIRQVPGSKVTTCLSNKWQKLPFRNYNVFQTELSSFRVFIWFPMTKSVKLLANLIM